AIASIGSVVALLIFMLVTIAHFRVRTETGANAVVLTLAVAAAGIVLVTFIFTDPIHEPDQRGPDSSRRDPRDAAAARQRSSRPPPLAGWPAPDNARARDPWIQQHRRLPGRRGRRGCGSRR